MAFAIAVTPDGSTAYIASQLNQKPAVTCTGQTGVVTPISTATNKAGTPITFRGSLVAMVVGVTP